MFAKEQSHCQRYINGFENDDRQYVIFVKKIKDMKDLIMNLDFTCLYWNCLFYIHRLCYSNVCVCKDFCCMR